MTTQSRALSCATRPKSTQGRVFFVVALCVISAYQPTYAISWTLLPSLQTQEIYSDNINLAPSNRATSAFVTDVSPGVSIIGQSARSLLNLNYRLQNLYNARGNDTLSSNHQLQFNANSVLAPNRFFLTSSSSVSQQNSNNTQIANDNISGAGASTTISTFNLTPRWTPHFGNYANANAQLLFNTVTTSSDTAIANPTLNSLSDSVSVGEALQINSGSEFKRVNWNVALNNSENYRASGQDVKFQNTNATIRTFINRYFNVFVQGGYSNNSFQSGTNNRLGNGLSYTAGVQWIPSRYYNIEAGYGNNRHITVNITPLQRLNWSTTFRDNDKGLNAGQTWQTALNYNTRRSMWSLTHNNDTTTTQSILSELQIFTQRDAFGNIVLDPITNQPIQRALYLNTLTDDVIVRKMWNFSVSFSAGRSTLAANAFTEDRVFQITGNHQQVNGINANWSVRVGAQTTAYISPHWQQTDRASTLTSAATQDNRYDVAIGLTQSITRQINGRLEFRHLNQTSDLTTNSFQENRATANLLMRF